MEILIYRHDESEESASIFYDVRLAIDHMKLRAIEEGKQWTDYIIKLKDDTQ